MDNPFLEFYSVVRILVWLGLAVLGFLLALIVRLIQGRSAGEAAKNSVEAGLTTLVGALFAQLIVAFFIWLGGATNAAMIGTGFFLMIWPGIIDMIGLAATGDSLWGVPGYLWIAMALGAGGGWFDGFHKVHNWSGLGVVTFISDFTWGLPLNVNAFLIHLINLGWGNFQDGDGRRGAHRYARGFAIKPGFAFTQGNVLSSLGNGPGAGIYTHEQTHVFQNRLFGPFFWMTYFGWLILFGAAGLIGMLAPGRNSANVRISTHFPMWWGYFNNPWELWAYTHNPTGRTGNLPSGDGTGWLDWPVVAKVILSIIGEAILLILILLAIWRIWFP
jgi:hypothetical protein